MSIRVQRFNVKSRPFRFLQNMVEQPKKKKQVWKNGNGFAPPQSGLVTHLHFLNLRAPTPAQERSSEGVISSFSWGGKRRRNTDPSEKLKRSCPQQRITDKMNTDPLQTQLKFTHATFSKFTWSHSTKITEKCKNTKLRSKDHLRVWSMTHTCTPIVVRTFNDVIHFVSPYHH